MGCRRPRYAEHPFKFLRRGHTSILGRISEAVARQLRTSSTRFLPVAAVFARRESFVHACPACVRSSCRLGPAQPSEFWKDSERCGCESRRHRCFRIATFSQWLSRAHCLRTKSHRHRTELHILTFRPNLFSARCSLERQRWLLRHSTADTKRELGAHKPKSCPTHTGLGRAPCTHIQR